MNELRKYINILTEDEKPRDNKGRLKSPHVNFEEQKTKIIAKLKSYNSAVYTRLGNNLERISELDDELKKLRKETKDVFKEHLVDLFSAEDAAMTRVVDTVQFVFTLSKDPKPTETYKYSAILEELSQELTPELLKVLENLKEKHKSVTQKAPSLRSERKDESVIVEGLDALKDFFARFKEKILSWASSYDNKLDRLKEKAGVSI